MTTQGVDVASYQPSDYDTTGLDFAFIKATQGTSYVNPKQTAQAADGRTHGLVVGFYHFLEPGSVNAQAAYFVDKCVSRAGDVLACDWEPTTSGLATNAEKDAFIKEVKRLRPDHRVILYCDVSRWTGVDKTSYCGDGLWIADPNHTAGHPNIKDAWLFHQYSETGGIDHNLGNFASKAALDAWAKALTLPTPGGTTVTAYDDVMKADKVPVATTHDKDGTWTAETALSYLVKQVDALRTELDAVKLQSETNGSGLSAIKLKVDAVDPASLEAALLAKIKSDLKLTVTVADPTKA